MTPRESDGYHRVIVTSPEEQTPDALVPRSRRELRTAAPAASRGGRRHWSRSRPAATVFATVAALCLAGACIGPAGLAMAEAAPAEEGVTVYDGMVRAAQSMTVAEDAETVTDLGRGNYETYKTPKPEPVVAVAASGGAAAAVLHYTGGGSPAEWMSAAGIPESEWGYVNYIVQHESGWNPNATNPRSGACGLVQAYPCGKVPGNGYDPVDNLRWANGYASKYGGWAGAYEFWINNRWW